MFKISPEKCDRLNLVANAFSSPSTSAVTYKARNISKRTQLLDLLSFTPKTVVTVYIDLILLKERYSGRRASLCYYSARRAVYPSCLVVAEREFHLLTRPVHPPSDDTSR